MSCLNLPVKSTCKKYFLTFLTGTTALLLTAFQPIIMEQKEFIGAWGNGTPENKTVMITTDKIFSVALIAST